MATPPGVADAPRRRAHLNGVRDCAAAASNLVKIPSSARARIIIGAAADGGDPPATPVAIYGTAAYERVMCF